METGKLSGAWWLPWAIDVQIYGCRQCLARAYSKTALLEAKVKADIWQKRLRAGACWIWNMQMLRCSKDFCGHHLLLRVELQASDPPQKFM